MISSGWSEDSRERMDQLGLERISDGEGLVDIWRVWRIDWRMAIRQLGQIGMVLELKLGQDCRAKLQKSTRVGKVQCTIGTPIRRSWKLPSQPHTPAVTVAHPCWRHTYRVSLDALPTPTLKLHLQRLPLRHYSTPPQEKLRYFNNPKR